MFNFQDILLDIVENTQIDPNFTVHHPNYPLIELQPEALDRLQRIPPQLQSKYLTTQVQNYLYNLYFTHSSMNLHELEIAVQQTPQIKNNLSDGVDVDFYQRLQQSNTSRGYLDRGWQVVSANDAGELIVVKGGLHLHINSRQHLPPDFAHATMGEIVPIYLPPNLVGQDTYIAIGNAGTPVAMPSDNEALLVQLYFNFTPDAAVAISDKLTRQLNESGVPFQLSILHDPALFYRYDGSTLWLSQSDYLAVQTLLAEIYQAHQSEFAADVPLFTKQLAPGLGLAEVSDASLIFGMQRCTLLARGLLAANDRGQTSVTDKLHAINDVFSTAGIDLLQPHLVNSDTPDCYDTYFT